MILGAIVFLAPLAAIAARRDPIASFPVVLACVFVSTLGWLLAWRSAERANGGGLAIVVGVTVAARVLLLVPEVPLSDDLYRYLWDGRVANAGINPFVHAPDSEALRSLRDAEIWPRINHPHVSTIYPPVAQLFFAMLDRIASHPLSPRVAASALDVATVLLLAVLMRKRGRSGALALVYGWCPLVVLESAAGGHVDTLGVAILVAAFLVLESPSRSRRVVGGLAIGLSALVKPMAVFLLPAFGWRQGIRGVALFALGGALSLLLFLPYLDAGAALARGFLEYAEHWHFNDSLYSVLVKTGLSPRVARGALAAALVILALALPRFERDPLRLAGCVLGAVLVLSPTVHPWYALWLVPFAPFLPRAVRPAAIAFLALLPLAYFSAWSRIHTGVWQEPAWTRASIWIPVFVLLVTGPRLARFTWSANSPEPIRSRPPPDVGG